MEILDEKVKNDTSPDSMNAAHDALDREGGQANTSEPAATPKTKAGPGRPKKGSEPDPRDKEPKPAPKPRKDQGDLSDARGGIIRAIEALAANVNTYGTQHPESDLQWVWRRLRDALPEEKGRIGAPIEESAFSPPVSGIVRAAELIGDLPEEEKASKDEINDVAQSWARASTHLGLSERVAAVGSAASKTVGLVGRQITRAVIRLIATPERSTLEVDMEKPPAPPEPGAAETEPDK